MQATRRFALGMWLGMLGTAAGCGGDGDATGLIVVVDTDYAVPDELARVRATVFDGGGAQGDSHLFELAPPDGQPIPFSFGVAPKGDKNGPVTVVVAGVAADGTELVERRARTRFVEGEHRLLPMFLARRCETEAAMCDAASETCTEDGCESIDVPPSSLEPVEPGDELRPRDGGMDGARDTGTGDTGMPDTGARDAGTGDTGMPDTGAPDTGTPDTGAPDTGTLDAGPDASPECTSAAQCNDGDPCTDDDCVGGLCVHTTRDADGDGHGDPACTPLGGVAADDCDEEDEFVNPSAPDDCNGVDDDCNGGCDTAFTCCAGETGTCTTACDTIGMRTCRNTCSWGVCSPPPEVCNGVDDDCNGECDDGLGCCQGTESPCTTSCGTRGTSTCGDDCSPGECVPPDETCDGADNDCDANIDEGFDCQGGDTRPCTTSCGSTGTETCESDCTFGSCVPPAEQCENGDDDDCDGDVDEGCTVSCDRSCPGATPVMAPGGRFTETLRAGSNEGSCGGTGSEAVLTFTLDTESDVFITTHGSPVDTVLYLRSCSCDGDEEACNDDADGLATSKIQLTNLPGGTYNLFVDSNQAVSAEVTVDIYISAPGSESDRCGQPTFIPAGTPSISGETCGFTNDYDLVTDGSGCPFSGGGDAEDRIYYFYLPAPRVISFEGCTDGSAYDSAIYVRSVCSDGTATSQLGCNDDGCSGPLSCTRAARASLTVSLPAGLHYLVVDGYFEGGHPCSCGPFQLDITGF